MARFRFRFQQLLDQRRLAEQQAQRDLSELLGRQQSLRDQLAHTQQRISDGKSELRGSLIGTIDIASISQFGRHNNHMLATGHTLVRQLASAQPHIDAARRRLHKAIRERKALELLHDREKQQWKHDINRRETATLDEAGTQMTLARRAS